jgi:hypothetical protein
MDIRTHVRHETTKVTRRRLQDRFDNECQHSLKSTKQRIETAQRRWRNLNFSSVSLPPIHPHRFLRSGADKLSQTLNNVRTTFGTLSQVSSWKGNRFLQNPFFLMWYVIIVHHCNVFSRIETLDNMGLTWIGIYRTFNACDHCSEVAGTFLERITFSSILCLLNEYKVEYVMSIWELHDWCFGGRSGDHNSNTLFHNPQ